MRLWKVLIGLALVVPIGGVRRGLAGRVRGRRPRAARHHPDPRGPSRRRPKPERRPTKPTATPDPTADDDRR